MTLSRKPGDSSTGARRRRRTGLLAVFTTGLLGLFIVLAYRSQPREPLLDRFKRRVCSELPVGSSLEDVGKWAQRVGGEAPRVLSWETESFPKPPQRVLPELAGAERPDLKSFVEIVIRWGRYEAEGKAADNHLWVFLMLDEHNRVKSHHFLTLAELAEIEKQRSPAR